MQAMLMLMGSPSPAAQPRAPAPARLRLVTIEEMRFTPRTLIVRRGERVRWINRDPFPHTVTAKNGGFDSHSIPAGGSWTFVARVPGTYDYVCTLHPTMTGRLEVR
jgi:plastocyanin